MPTGIFHHKVHIIGMVTLALAILANFLPVAYLAVVYGIAPSLSELAQIWTAVAASYGFNWVIQPPSFFPVLGIVGTYVAFLSGSLADVRMPVITAAQKLTNTEAGSPEGDAVAALAVTTSVFVTFVLFTIFVVVGNRIIAYFPEFVIHAFTYIVPAIFSAVFVNMASRNLRLGLPIFALCAGLTIVFPLIGIKSAFANIAAILLAICYAKGLFTVDQKKVKKQGE